MFELMILANLYVQPCYGYELKSRLYQMKPNNNKVYPILHTLKQHGYIIGKMVLQGDKPNKTVYSLTSTGEKHFRDLLAEFDEYTAQNSEAFSIRMAFCSLIPPQKVMRILELREAALDIQARTVNITNIGTECTEVQELREMQGKTRQLELAYIYRMKERYARIMAGGDDRQ